VPDLQGELFRLAAAATVVLLVGRALLRRLRRRRADPLRPTVRCSACGWQGQVGKYARRCSRCGSSAVEDARR
jgi:predicted Zn-ribbon and HTH transcriptional regulator